MNNQNGNGRTSGRDVFLIIGLVSIVSCCGFPILGELSRRLEAAGKTDQKSPGVVAPATQNSMLNFMKQYSEQAIRQTYPGATIVFGEMSQGQEDYGRTGVSKKVITLRGTLKMYGTANEIERTWTTTFVGLNNATWIKAVCQLDEASFGNTFKEERIEKPSVWVD